MAYLLDSNVFIEAKNRYYGFNFHPGFWKWLDHAHAKGSVLSIKQVRDELMEREDRLTLWCRHRKPMFVETEEPKTYESMKLLAPWVCQNYLPAAQAKFLGCADCVLVAYAHAHNHTVVTIEKAKKGMEVKIPNACREMAVPVMTPFAMLAAENVKFHFNP
ncbi:MAG TPA: DUF4411 family protein [Verrucomicrobiae bacterium]|jgi:hypothetical protein|nr:DUF4411 family protein [Verrucomicrobiae bacterium]